MLCRNTSEIGYTTSTAKTLDMNNVNLAHNFWQNLIVGDKDFYFVSRVTALPKSLRLSYLHPIYPKQKAFLDHLVTVDSYSKLHLKYTFYIFIQIDSFKPYVPMGLIRAKLSELNANIFIK